MAKNILRYEEHFSAGMRILVEIPLPGEKTFRDDAEILSLQHDLLELRLSRTILPEAANLEIGTPLCVRTGKKGRGFRCRGILLEYDGRSALLIRLTGEILTHNDREYFRIDVYIPLKYHLSADSAGTKAGEITAVASRDNQIGLVSAATASAPEEPLPVAANLSGAGARIHVPDRFGIDRLLELTLFLPPAYGGAMTLKGQVVYVVPLGRQGDPRQLFDTALRFVDVDDPHRDSLLKFIHHMQLEQLRRLREQSAQLLKIEPEKSGWRGFSPRKKIILVLCAVSAALIAAGLILVLAGYYNSRSKGEIEKTFEDQVRKLIDQQ